MALPLASAASDGEEKSWYDQLCQYLCFIGSRYGFNCHFVDGTPPELATLVRELEAAFVAHGPIGNPPQSHYLEIIEALEILDAHYEEVGEPTNHDLDMLLTEIYFAEGGDPAFLP
jgi:hypothetical protein